MEQNSYICFDRAMKRLLRDKANFGVLEGLLTVLIGEQIHIVEIPESESNRQTAEEKFNRVDIKAKNSKDEIIIVEMQEGLQEGLQEGRQEGFREGLLAAAKQLKDMGLSLDEIIKASGIDREAVETL